MEQTYLPGTIQDRIRDLLKERKLTQADLAAEIDMTESTLSRFLSGKTDKLGDDQVIRIARFFNVSTDFLLGETNAPDRKNYDIAELGLSVQAARNLYSGQVNADVVNRLLENRHFAKVTTMIALYLDESLASAFAAQNQLYASLSAFLTGENPDPTAITARQDLRALQTPAFLADQANIQAAFMQAVNEIKKESGTRLPKVKASTKQVTEKVFAEMTKGQDRYHPKITPELFSEAVVSTVEGTDQLDPEAVVHLKQAITEIAQSIAAQKQNDE